MNVVLLLIREKTTTMISLSIEIKKNAHDAHDDTCFNNCFHKTDIIWNLDNLTVVLWFFFQKSRIFSNQKKFQMEQIIFDKFVSNEQIIDNITQ